MLLGLAARRRAFIKAFAFILLASLTLSLVLTYRAPTAAFYLLPTRAWELAIGCLLAVAPRPQAISSPFFEVVGWAGLMAIGAACVLFNNKTPFPGWAALLPTLGAAAVIWANAFSSRRTWLERGLSSPPLVFVGKISYSFYLWHWPLLVYSEYWTLNPLRWYVRILLVVASAGLAVLSWWLIETPFRTRKVLSTRGPLLAFGAASVGCYLCLGVMVEILRGAPSRFPVAAEKYASGKQDFPFTIQTSLSQAERGEFTFVGGDSSSPIHCMVWGDSHAMAVIPAIERLAQEAHSRVAVATHFATAPILGVECTSEVSIKNCDAWGQSVLSYVKQMKIPDVLLVARWCTYEALARVGDKRLSQPELAAKLSETVLALQSVGARVWIMKEVPTYHFDIPRALARAAINGEPMDKLGMPQAEYAQASSVEDRLLGGALLHGAAILDPKSVLVNQSGFCMVGKSGFSLYRDSDHLSSRGAMILKPLFSRIWSNPDHKAPATSESAGSGGLAQAYLE